MGFSRQGYWSGWPCPSPDLPDSGIELVSLMCWQTGSLPLVPPGRPDKGISYTYKIRKGNYELQTDVTQE